MKIGFVGLGTMGGAMCANIVKKHDGPVYVYDVLPEKTERLQALGALACRNCSEIAKKSDLLITMLPRTEHVEAAWNEMIPGLDAGEIGIDMSTIDPSVSIAIADRVRAEAGAGFADCPVVKSKKAAQDGTLGIYAGCEAGIFKKIYPVLAYMGENVVYMGKNGMGITMKICQNALSHEIQAAVNETLTLAQLMGIRIDDFAGAVSCGGAANYYLESKYKAIRDRDYTVSFPVEYALKDLEICGRMAGTCQFEMPILQHAISRLSTAMEMGLAKADNCACIEAVRKGTALDCSDPVPYRQAAMTQGDF